MPRDIIPTKHNPTEDTSDPILTASPEMKSPGGTPNLGSIDDKQMADMSSTSSQDTEDDGEGEDAEGHPSRPGRNPAMPGNLAFKLFREIYDRDDPKEDMEVELSQKFKNNNGLHPYVQVLSITDVDGCVAVENAAFPEDQRASREKLIYRLTTCPYICLGLFTSTPDPSSPSTESMYAAARAPDSKNPSHKALLVGHVIATLTTSPFVTEESMQLPVSFPSHPESSTEAPVLDRAPSTSLPDSAFPRVNQEEDAPGHHPLGRTLAVHSVAVHPEYQKQGLGKVLFKAYLQRMEGSGIADRVAMLAKKDMVDFYTSVFGFEDAGESQVQFGGGEWRNLVTTLFGFEK